MGYVLPINHYQYYDYQIRTIKEKSDPFPIEKPYKTILRTDYHDNHRNQINIKSSDHSGINLSKPRPPTAESIYAELTGKGRNFSSTI